MDLKAVFRGRPLPYRAITRVLLGIGLVVFVLPFATVSCGGHDVLTATGLNTIAGGPYSVEGSAQHYSGDLAFLLAVFGGVVALACQFLRFQVRTRAVASGAASVWSVVMLLVGQAHVNTEFVDLHSNGVVTVRWDAGFWIALIAIGAGAVMAGLELFAVRSMPGGSSAIAGPGAFRFAWFRTAGTMPRSLVAMAGGCLAVVASLLIIVACQLPYIRYTDSSIQPSTASVFNTGFAPANWFAAEPVGVALLAVAAGVVLIAWMSLVPRAIAAAVVLAFGAQTFLLFLGYVVLAVKSPSAQLGAGGVVGMIAGVLLFASGLAAALTLFERNPVQAAGEAPAADTTA